MSNILEFKLPKQQHQRQQPTGSQRGKLNVYRFPLVRIVYNTDDKGYYLRDITNELRVPTTIQRALIERNILNDHIKGCYKSGKNAYRQDLLKLF